jgi:hypothetical protein
LDKFNSIARISLLKVSKSLTVSYICWYAFRKSWSFRPNQNFDINISLWKFEVKCIIREGNYLDVVILQSICNSLKGPARNLLLTLSENAIPWQILDELEGVYSSDAST